MNFWSKIKGWLSRKNSTGVSSQSVDQPNTDSESIQDSANLILVETPLGKISTDANTKEVLLDETQREVKKNVHQPLSGEELASGQVLRGDTYIQFPSGKEIRIGYAGDRFHEKFLDRARSKQTLEWSLALQL